MKKAIILILVVGVLSNVSVNAQEGSTVGVFFGGNYSALTGVSKFEPKALPGIDLGVVFSGRGKVMGWDLDFYYSWRQSNFKDFYALYTFHFLGLGAMFKVYPFKKLGLNVQLGYQLNFDLGNYSSVEQMFVRGFVIGLAYDIGKRWTIDFNTWVSARPVITQSIKELEYPADGGLPQEVYNTYEFYLSTLSLSVTYKLWELKSDH